MNADILNQGQYLGQTIKSYETDMLSVKSTLHEKSESKFHSHSNAYLSILLNGLYSEETTRDSQKVITASHVLYRPAYFKHKNQFITEKTKCLNIEFDPDWFDKHDIDAKQLKPQIKTINNYPWVLSLLVDFLIHGKIDFFEELLTQLISGEEQPNRAVRKPWLGKLAQILENEVEQNHSLSTLSQRVFVHPNYMSRGFKNHFGVTIGQYQLQQKVKHATQKLFIAEHSIAQIATDCGFFDEAHFIRTFKARHHITPHQFRLLLK